MQPVRIGIGVGGLFAHRLTAGVDQIPSEHLARLPIGGDPVGLESELLFEQALGPLPKTLGSILPLELSDFPLITARQTGALLLPVLEPLDYPRPLINQITVSN
jgi:hypothetical protein